MTADFFCVLEAKESDWEWAKRALDEHPVRRLVFINSPFIFDHPQVKYRSIDSPLQIGPLARQIAWEAVLLKMEIIGGQSDMCLAFHKELEKAHLAANLLLSDGADFGCAVARHCFMRKGRSVRNGMQLVEAFTNVPAIVVGAGPSLEKNGHLLEALKGQALVLAGGSALNALQIEPHFAASLDKEAPYRDFKKFPFWETPFCFQSRMSPENFSLVHGEALLFPDSHFRFLGEGNGFDGGWTVGTFLVSLATLMGCDPIVFVGMDYCYQAGKKYAADAREYPEPNLVEITAKDGNKVWTQPDWLMARSWLEEWAVKHPQRRFLDATEGGLGFHAPIQTIRLGDLRFAPQGDLRRQVHGAVASLPMAPSMRWEEWKQSLETCRQLVEQGLFGKEVDFEKERVYESLLLPLWSLWGPIFARAVELDLHPEKEKMRIHQLLFFQQVIQEHLRAIE